MTLKLSLNKSEIVLGLLSDMHINDTIGNKLFFISSHAFHLFSNWSSNGKITKEAKLSHDC